MIGVVMLVHEQPRRTMRLARFMAGQGCKVAIHVDARAPEERGEELHRLLDGSDNILMVPRRRCNWGMFSLVEAAIDGVRLLLDRWPEITHVCQLSGSCIPIKPIPALQAHLAAHADTDFIESVALKDDPWVVDGLSIERFTLYHPLSWRRHRRTFDRLVRLQRLLRVERRMPQGLEPRLGSQWWCLSRRTFEAILDDPQFDAYCRFFRTTWIPDESFFQTLAAKHSDRIASRSLTFVRFDGQGKPYSFYDDHLEMLLQADGWFARKIWRGANRIYDTFLSPDLAQILPDACDGGRVLRRFERARKLHRDGRTGLVSHGRHPGRRLSRGAVPQFETARPYLVVDGVDRVLPDLVEDMNMQPGVIAHGQLFHPDRIEFAEGRPVFTGNLTDSVPIRDHKPVHFLSKLVWIERRQTQAFLHHFHHAEQISRFILGDPNARVLRLADGWLFDLFTAWRLDPASLATVLPQMLEQEQRAQALLTRPARASVQTVRLEEMLAEGSTVPERFAAHAPRSLRIPALFGALRLPENFGAFVTDLAACRDTPAGVAALQHGVARYEGMTRILRRKT